MIILLYGADSYRRQEKLKEYIDRYKVKYQAFSLSNFYLEREGDFERLKDFSRAQSLFEISRLGIISGMTILGNKDQKDLIKILRENLETKDLTLIINEDKKTSKEFKFLLDKPVIIHEFGIMMDSRFQDFFQAEAKKRNLNFDRRSRDLLVQYYAGNSWGLITELDKLALLDEKTISFNVLKNHFDISLPVNAFSAIQQIKNSFGLASRLSSLERLFFQSEDAAMIFNILATFYGNNVWKNKIADYDAAIKSGKLEYEEVLLDLAIEQSS